MAKKRRRGTVKKGIPRPRPPRRPAEVVGEAFVKANRLNALRVEAIVTDVALAGCPSYTVRWPLPGETAVTIQAERGVPAICQRCGRLTDAVAYEGCPRMLSGDQAMMLKIPAEHLHAVAG